MRNQSEAKNRFEGLLGLFNRVHDKARKPINTVEELTSISSEARHLCEAFDEELTTYISKFGHEMMHKPTIVLILDIQTLAACTGMHIQLAGARLEHIVTNSQGIADAAESMRWN